MARIWHAPSYHIVKGFFTPKGPQFKLNKRFFKVFWGHKVGKILYIVIYREPYIHHGDSPVVHHGELHEPSGAALV